MKNVDQIVQELLSIDPSFKAHEKELRTIISELLSKKPDTHLDAQFVARLRAQLQGKPTTSPFSRFMYMPYAIVAVLALAIIVPFGYNALQNNSSGTAVFAMNQDIQKLPSGAYGTLQTQAGGLGGGAGAAVAPQAADASASLGSEAAKSFRQTSAPATMAVGAGATPAVEPAANLAVSDAPSTVGSGQAKMMIPNGPITQYSYVYKGDDLDLSATDGDVYSRVTNKVSSGQIATQLKKFNFGLLNLGGYSDLRVRSFELTEDKPYGYSISANFDDGSISINPDYLQWPSMNGKESNMQPLPKAAMLSNDEAIAIANAFLKDHNISMTNYGDPVVQDFGVSIAADSQLQYAPEQIQVTYPLKIKGTQVYEEGAYPYGLQVTISVRDKKAMSVYGLTSQTYTSSSYKLETDSSKVLAALQKGGVNAWIPEASSGIEIKKVSIDVGTPTKVLMHSYQYTNGQSKELYVPALSFPVTTPPAGDQYYPKYIVIPLVPELLNQQSGPIMYDIMR